MNARLIGVYLVWALLVPGSTFAASSRLDQGDVVARISVDAGNVYLQTRSGKPIVVPGHLSLRQGDVLTTPEKVTGRFELVRGGNIPLAPLHRYRVSASGIEEAAGNSWQPVAQGLADARQVVAGGDGTGGLIAKVRLAGGGAFHRPHGWPQAVPAHGSLSLAAGDELRLEPGALAQVQYVNGGWLYMEGPAIAVFDQDSIRIESGSALAKSLGTTVVALGPYRIHGGARVFSFASTPPALTVSALTGVLTVEVDSGRPVYLAPGRRVKLRVGHAPIIAPIAIRPEIQWWEELFRHPGSRAPRVAAAPEPEEKQPEKKREPPVGLKTKNPLGEGPERRSGPPDPRVEEPHPVAVLPLRDRLHGMESFRSRQFYVKKRQEKEATAEYETFQDQVGKSGGDEVQAFRLFKFHRAQLAARQELDDFRHERELSFNEKPYRAGAEKDARVREERERLFGEPLFLDTRRLLLFAETNRQNLINAANATTRDIEIARATGAPDATIAALQVRRQDDLNLADQQTDGMKELFRIAMEPYR